VVASQGVQCGLGWAADRPNLAGASDRRPRRGVPGAALVRLRTDLAPVGPTEVTMLRLVFSTAPAGVDVADYDGWYEQHIRHVVAVPGFLRARRFTVNSRPGRR
jgi:hypothetical protein